MSDGFPNKPKIFRGAFVEYGLSLPPLLVVFQFNPQQVTRNRRLSYSVASPPPPPPPRAGSGEAAAPATAPAAPQQQRSLRSVHARCTSLEKIREQQVVDVGEETIGFEIRLDATDKLNDDDAIASIMGIAPQLATLELMVHPKDESLLGKAFDLLLGKKIGFSFTDSSAPPTILMIFGPQRVLPVNINSMNITETEFNQYLNPIRATVTVELTVIEGKNPLYLYTKGVKEVMSALNLANIADVANVVIPG